jgi:F-type H+-transporting ATPase subunit b
MVNVNVPIVIVQAITFLLGMWFVWNSMIKALINTLKEREGYIKSTLDKIEKDKGDIESMKADYEKKAHEMHAQSAAAYNKAIADGEKIKESMLEEAKKEGAKLVIEAKNEIEAEKRKAIEEVKDAIVDISMAAAEKAIGKKITKKDQISIVDGYMKEIGKSSN